MGVGCVLEASKSGRAFLQEHGLLFENAPSHDKQPAALLRAGPGTAAQGGEHG